MDPVNQKSSSNKWLYIVIGVLVLIVIGVALKGSMTRKVNVGGYGVDVTQKMDGSTTYKSDYGTTTINGNKWPDNWPTDVPKYSNATVTTSGATSAQAGVEGYQVLFNTSDSAQAVLDFYKSGLTASGWTSGISGKAITGSQVGGMIVLSAQKEKRTVTLGITNTDGQSKVTLVVASMPEIKTGL